MDNLLTIQKTTYEHDILDLDSLLHERMTSLVQKVRAQLLHMKNSKRLQDYTRNKIQHATCLLETIDEHWKLLPFNSTTHQISQHMLQQFEQTFSEVSDNYRQLEQLQENYFDYTFLDETMDSLMACIEQIDTCIGDAIDKASVMRNMVHEKFSDFAGVAHEHVDHLKAAISYGAVRLLAYEELPTGWRSNMYIHSGYRFLSTPRACFHSWFYLHNESGNIFTHLIGFIAFFCIGIYELFYSKLLSDAPVVDWIIFTTFFVAVCKCLMCSMVWHTLSGINDYHLFTRVACLDYVGISALICASLMLSEYYGFYCNVTWRNTYLIGSGSLAVIGIFMPLMPWFDRPESRWIRIMFFVALASSGFIPILHLLSVYDFGHVIAWMSPVLKSILCYVVGTIVYGNRFPERFWPGRFDHFGHSHQWWHLCVCAGIWWNYVAATSYVAQRYEFGMCSL
ncbi:hemolysin-III related-domain-containing protein [Absidia repens]|uniref:Hemolysin-III related-domain-containing protein n=1 Tax=Absidia repens TaxID=90262 RepID=A0A1X2IHF4_9FUNG|nr:hemolysin-III related-domain-containing protein [Absidia repens]